MFILYYTNQAGVETSSGPYCSWTEAQIAASELQAQGGTAFHIERSFVDYDQLLEY